MAQKVFNMNDAKKALVDLAIGTGGFVGTLTLQSTLSIIVGFLTIAVLLKRLLGKDKKDE